MLTDRDQQITDIRKAYTGLNVELAHIQQRFLATTLELEAKHRHLEQLIARKQALTQNIGSSPANTSADAAASGNSDTAKAEVSEYAQLSGDVSSSEAFGRTVQALEERLSHVRSDQRHLVSAFSKDADSAIGTLEDLIGQTGLDVERVLAQLGNTEPPAGGPLITAGAIEASEFSHISEQIKRLALLRKALYSLPLVEPVDNYYVSSNYGYRRDPITRRRAFHGGLDMVAPISDPVLASAPGVVISAGRNGPYGKMIELDHGHGIKSRYGHLEKINVSKGDTVVARQPIGKVGNTGRSTGPHLHFEVWFDGKARNPRKFLKAGENVFER